MSRLFVIVLLAMGIAACGQQAPSSPAPPPSPLPPLSTFSTPAGGFGVTEQAFIQLAIATDDQAVKLLDLGAARATKPLLRAFANELATTRQAELTALRDLLRSESVPYQNLHEGHDMPGMPTDTELTILAASATFDADFTRLARAHLIESKTVARSAAEQVTHTRTRTLAATILEERETSLTRLDGLR
jgi:uncharacterized protein (DUF305 family)